MYVHVHTHTHTHTHTPGLACNTYSLSTLKCYFVQITPGGKAAKGGLRFNDYILEINGDSTESLLHSDAMMLIKTTGMTLVLKLSHDPPKSPQVQPKFAGYEETDQPAEGERPHPPPPPSNVAADPPPSQPAIHSSSVAIRTTPKKREIFLQLSQTCAIIPNLI